MRLITLAIHTYDHAVAVKNLLEAEGIPVTLQNVNLEQPEVSSGVRVRIPETDLPLALRIVENPEFFGSENLANHIPQAKRTILVPTDYSHYSILAAQVAIRMAAASKADICFLHSYIDPQFADSIQLTDNLNYDQPNPIESHDLTTIAEGEMKKFAKTLKKMMKEGQLPLVKFTTQVVEGVPEESIIEYSKLNPPYLVVMGTRSSVRKDRELIGSVTAEVLDECRFAVLTIPENISPDSFTRPRNILFFSNLDQEDILAMDTLYRYFSNSHSDVTIVHIPQRHRFTDRTAGKTALALSEYCSKTFSHFNFHSVPIQPKSAIEEFDKLQKEHHYDLLVIPNRKKNVLSRLFNPGLAHKILFQADIPMLVIPV